ncbi:hypothetical protein EXE58_07625 [Nocardioides seonyuensis]|uniref:Carboxypeptidase regulatory-like domain-containing protein n=1 Tax=Nocardioides seonyuensis TaxID=2518371 RepID=A0A4P7IDT6_9ACTN|nr:hypothetical protein [Nocardioides seonyuensis]QBX55336.1 hypothetical protein EXE58_07625 [Nocardioides seonyuensis]
MSARHRTGVAALVVAASLATAPVPGSSAQPAEPPVRGRFIASPGEVSPRQAILLTGLAGGHLPRPVVLQLRTPDGWTPLQRKLTREGGLFRFTHRAPRTTGMLVFRVRVPAAPHIGGDASVTPTRRVRVTA